MMMMMMMKKKNSKYALQEADTIKFEFALPSVRI
jgi:hypothetical protein